MQRQQLFRRMGRTPGIIIRLATLVFWETGGRLINRILHNILILEPVGKRLVYLNILLLTFSSFTHISSCICSVVIFKLLYCMSSMQYWKTDGSQNPRDWMSEMVYLKRDGFFFILNQHIFIKYFCTRTCSRLLIAIIALLNHIFY